MLFVLRWPYRRRNLHIDVLQFVPQRSPNDYENSETMRRAIPDAGLQRSEVQMGVQ